MGIILGIIICIVCRKHFKRALSKKQETQNPSERKFKSKLRKIKQRKQFLIHIYTKIPPKRGKFQYTKIKDTLKKRHVHKKTRK